MGIRYRIDKERSVTFVLWNGLVTGEQFLTHAQRMTADPDWPPKRRLHLSDLRAATVDVSIDEAVLKQAAAIFGRHGSLPQLRVAIVAGPWFEKANEFERLLTPYRPYLFVFNSLTPACEWLGIAPADVEEVLQALRGPASESTGR
jgi:hypothetical protein